MERIQKSLNGSQNYRVILKLIFNQSLEGFRKSKVFSNKIIII